MSSQERTVSPIKDTLSTPSYNRGVQVEEKLFTPKRDPTEQREVSSDPADVNSLPPSTMSQTSTDSARPLPGYHERVGNEDTAGTVEPGENLPFLHKNNIHATSTEQTKTKAKGSTVKLLKTWWLEVVSLIIAVSALIAIVATVAEYNAKEQPDWKYAINININTVVAILSTLMRACLVAVAEQAISQLKWLSFRQPRPLQHLTHFDEASRGPWGSLLLYFRTRTLNAALLGCIVIVLSVGIGPFTQQAVKAVPCNRPEASIRISRWMDLFNLDLSTSVLDMDLESKVAVLDGLVNPNTTRSEIIPSCNTGNCLFPSHNGVTHSSVGMCKKCVDITPWLSELETVFQHPDEITYVYGDNGTFDHSWNRTVPDDYQQDIVLPDGHGIGGGNRGLLPRKIIDVNGNVWRNQPFPLNDSLPDAFDDSFESIFRSSVLNISVITFTNNDCHAMENGQEQRNCSKHGFVTSYPFLKHLNVVATTCSFYPCVRDYYGAVRNTVFTETVVRDTPIVPPLGQQDKLLPDFVHLHTPCLIEGQAYTMDNISSVTRNRHNVMSSYVDQVNMTFPTECAYGLSGFYALGLVNFMQEALFGNCTALNFNGDADDYNSLVCNPWYLKGLANGGNASFQSIDLNMQSIATAITSEIRKKGTDYSKREHPEQIYATGTATQIAVCTEFDWKWLSFPLALATLTSLVLCISCGKMFFDTQKIPAWKSSVLPLLLTGSQTGATTGAGDMDNIKANTNNVVVSLAHFEKGWEFVVENCEDTRKKDS